MNDTEELHNDNREKRMVPPVRRKPTPPQTLFPDYQTAHSSIIARPGNIEQNSSLTDWRTGFERPVTPPLPPLPDRALLIGGSAQVPYQVDKLSPQLEYSKMANKPFGRDDVASESSYSSNVTRRVVRTRSLSDVDRCENAIPMDTAVREVPKDPRLDQSDTISDIISEYDNLRDHQRSQSFDSMFTLSSAAESASLMNCSNETGQHDGSIADPTETLRVGRVSVNRGYMHGARFSTWSKFPAELDTPSGEVKDMRLKSSRRSTSEDSALGIELCNLVLPREVRTSQTKGNEDPARTPRSLADHSARSRHLTGSSSTATGVIRDDKDVDPLTRLTYDLNRYFVSPMESHPKMAQSQDVAVVGKISKPLPNIEEENTEQDWETVHSSERTQSATNASNVTGSLPFCKETGMKRTRALSLREASSSEEQLRPIKACLDIPSLVKKTSEHPHPFVSATKRYKHSTYDHTATQVLPIVACLPRLASVYHKPASTVSLTQTDRRKQRTLFHDSSLSEPHASPALQSSSLFPHLTEKMADTSSESDSDFLWMRGPPPKQDKGKQKATDVDTDEPKLKIPHSHHTDITQGIEPNLTYEDVFDEINYAEPSRAASCSMIATVKKPFDPTYQSLSQCSNDGSYVSDVSKHMQQIDPDNDADVSAVLRATRFGRGVTVETGPSHPKDIFKKNDHEARNTNKGQMTTDLEHRSTGVNLDVNASGSKSRATHLTQVITRIKPANETNNRGRSHGYGVDGVTGVSRSNGDRISRAERLIRHEDNLPEQNTFSFASNLPALIHGECTEVMVRQRLTISDDEWSRLKHECPQFPLREEHFTSEHPIKKGEEKYVRLEKMENGEWLEQAYCTYHNRAEFSATKGLVRKDLDPAKTEDQHKAGKLAIFWGCFFFPFGGFVILKELEEDRGCAADVMRAASGNGLIDRPHAEERRLAGLMLEVMSLVWLFLVGAALAGCVWAATQKQ